MNPESYSGVSAVFLERDMTMVRPRGGVMSVEQTPPEESSRVRVIVPSIAYAVTTVLPTLIWKPFLFRSPDPRRCDGHCLFRKYVTKEHGN